MITVLGSINMDLVANVRNLPRPGETVAGESFMTAPGGKGANQALSAARAGGHVVMAGAVGSDEFAGPAISYLRQAGVDLSGVRTVQGATGVALIFVGSMDGENVIAVIAGANGTVSSQEAEAAVGRMKKADILMVQMEIPSPAIEAGLLQARKLGVTTIANTAPLTKDAVRLAGLADIVIANETEFELFCGKSTLSAEEREAEMLELSGKSGQTLIVTLGADGMVAARDGKLIRASALKITPVDTVGAGDTFCGYLAASLDGGFDFELALKRAAIAGSLACTRHGAQPSIPLAGEVAEYLL